MSAKEEYIALLRQNRGKFRTVSNALRILSNKFQPGLTLGGGMLPSGIALSRQPKVLWVTIEFAVSNPHKIPKRDRMYPIAVRHGDQKTVFRHHSNFYKKGWEKTTQGWLTPSGEMGVYRQWQIEHLVFSTNNDAKLVRSLHTAMSKLVKVVTIYPDGEKLIFLEPNGSREWPLEACPRTEGHVTAKPFLGWLNSFVKDGLECQFYVGRDVSIEEDARLYAAFTKTSTARDIVTVCKVAEILHETRIRDAIRETLIDGVPKVGSDFKWSFGDDIGQAIWKGEHLPSFNKTQAAVIALMYARSKAGQPWVGSDTILKAVTQGYRRVRDIFRYHPAWGTLIISERRSKGPYKLNI